VPASAGDSESKKRFLQLGRGLSLELGASRLRDPILSSLARFFRPLSIDLVRALGDVGQYHYLIRTHFEETTGDGEVVFLAIGPVKELPGGQRSDERLVAVQDTEVAFRSASDDNIRVVLENRAFGRNHFQPDRRHLR